MNKALDHSSSRTGEQDNLGGDGFVRSEWTEKAMELATDFGVASLRVGSYERKDAIFNPGRASLQTVDVRAKREAARAALRAHLEEATTAPRACPPADRSASTDQPVTGDRAHFAYTEALAENARLREALNDLIGWIPGPSHWHTDGPEKAIERARAALKGTK